MGAAIEGALMGAGVGGIFGGTVSNIVARGIHGPMSSFVPEATFGGVLTGSTTGAVAAGVVVGIQSMTRDGKERNQHMDGE